MSKKVLIAGLLLMLPAVGFAQEVSLSVVAGNTFDGPFTDSVVLPTAPSGTEIVIWTFVESSVPLDGLGYKLHVNSDADNGKFEIADYAPGKLSSFGDQFDGLGEAFALIPDPTETDFSTAAYAFATTPISLADLNEVIFETNTVPNVAAEGESVIGYILKTTTDLAPGDYVVSALGPIDGSPNAEWSSTPQNGPLTAGNDLTITVLPEPTSALLLLAAVPFLRRRRA